MANVAVQIEDRAPLLREIVSNYVQAGAENDINPEFVASVLEAVKHRVGPMSFDEAVQRGYI